MGVSGGRDTGLPGWCGWLYSSAVRAPSRLSLSCRLRLDWGTRRLLGRGDSLERTILGATVAGLPDTEQEESPALLSGVLRLEEGRTPGPYSFNKIEENNCFVRACQVH